MPLFTLLYVAQSTRATGEAVVAILIDCVVFLCLMTDFLTLTAVSSTKVKLKRLFIHLQQTPPTVLNLFWTPGIATFLSITNNFTSALSKCLYNREINIMLCTQSNNLVNSVEPSGLVTELCRLSTTVQYLDIMVSGLRDYLLCVSF